MRFVVVVVVGRSQSSRSYCASLNSGVFNLCTESLHYVGGRTMVKAEVIVQADARVVRASGGSSVSVLLMDDRS